MTLLRPTRMANNHMSSGWRRNTRADTDEHRLRPHLRKYQPAPKPAPIEQPLRPGRRTIHPADLQRMGVKVLSRNRSRLLAPPIRQPHSFPSTTRHDILSRANRKCYLCGKPLTITNLQVDHIIPIARGGTHHVSNLAASCRPCNTTKRDHIVAFSIRTRKPHYIPW